MRHAFAVAAFVALFSDAGVARPAEETVFAEAKVPCPVIVRDAEKRSTPPPLLVGLHGRGDEAVLPDTRRRARARLEKLGFAVTYREFKGGHHVDGATLREAHAWLEAIEVIEPATR